MDSIFKELPWHKKIKVLRTVSNMSQKEVAQKCLTGQKEVWLWESGRNYPRPAKRKAIAEVFGLKIEEIFSAGDEII